MTEQELYRKLGIGYRKEIIYRKLRELEATHEDQFTQGLCIKFDITTNPPKAVVYTPIGQKYIVDIHLDD